MAALSVGQDQPCSSDSGSSGCGGRRYLVTGGCGFIGSHLTDLLLRQGHSVVVVDNLSTGKRANLPLDHPRLRVVIEDFSAFTAEGEEARLDGIFHLAATAAVQASWEQPLKIHENNLSQTVRVIELAQRNRIPRIVFASSAAVYGDAQPPISEKAAARPISPYGLQKLVSEQYGQMLCSNSGLIFVACRFFNVYGPRQDPSSPYSGVISRFAQLLAEGKPLTIFGDGEQTRDFVFVKDVAEALVLAMTTALPSSFMAVNVATGKFTSVKALAAMLAGCFPGHKLELVAQPARLGDIRDSYADISCATQALQWQPQVALQAGLKETVQWMQGAKS
eukprot:RCo050718